MEAVLEGQMEVKAWRSGIEDRLERLEASWQPCRSSMGSLILHP